MEQKKILSGILSAAVVLCSASCGAAEITRVKEAEGGLQDCGFMRFVQKFRAFASEKLTELANDWQDEGYDDEDGEALAAITEESFAGRIVISELSIDAEGDYEVCYDDDDMFGDHVIIVSGSVDGGMEDAHIAG